MSADSSWWGVFMLSVLYFLARIESWHLVAGGVTGAVLCIGLGRTTTLRLVGATLCSSVALAGVAAMWRSYAAPRQIAVVTARTIGARGGDDAVEWKFEDPRSIFLHSRRPGDALWIEGIRIFAKNLSDRPLNNLTAVVRSRTGGKDMKMYLVRDDRQVGASDSLTVPSKSEFLLLYIIPSMLDDRVSGIPADQFLRAFGDLDFMFGYDTNQMFSRLVSVPEIEQQLLRIEREDGNALPTPANRRP